MDFGPEGEVFMKEHPPSAWRLFLSELVYAFNRNKISWIGVVILPSLF